MITLSEMFVLDLQIGTVRDVLMNSEDLISFKIVVGSRGELPSLEISFTSSNVEVFKSMNEMNFLTLTYGRTLSNARINEWDFKFPSISKVGADKYKYDLTCLLRVPNYLSNSKAECYKGSSKSAIQAALASTGLILDAKVDCKDVMSWIRDTTVFKFIQDTYLRYWSGDEETCAAVAVTLDKELRFYDLRKHILEKMPNPDFKTSLVSANKSLAPDMFSIKPGDGLLNDWVGNGRNFLQYNLDTGEIEDIKPNLSRSLFETQASMDQLLNRKSDQVPRPAPPQSFCGDNVHENWNRAYAQNLTRLALVSSIGVSLQYQGRMVELDPLDLVVLSSQEIKSKGDSGNRYSYTYTGLYLVDSWSLQYVNNHLLTRIDLTRDANSDMKVGG